MVVIDVQPCEYAKNHWNVSLKDEFYDMWIVAQLS